LGNKFVRAFKINELGRLLCSIVHFLNLLKGASQKKKNVMNLLHTMLSMKINIISTYLDIIII